MSDITREELVRMYSKALDIIHQQREALYAAQQQITALKLHIKDEKAFADQLLDAQQQIAALMAERETLELKLSACSVAALGNTPATVAERIAPSHPYYSASYGDVCNAVDREIIYREALDNLNAHPVK